MKLLALAAAALLLIGWWRLRRDMEVWEPDYPETGVEDPRLWERIW